MNLCELNIFPTCVRVDKSHVAQTTKRSHSYQAPHGFHPLWTSGRLTGEDLHHRVCMHAAAQATRLQNDPEASHATCQLDQNRVMPQSTSQTCESHDVNPHHPEPRKRDLKHARGHSSSAVCGTSAGLNAQLTEQSQGPETLDKSLKA